MRRNTISGQRTFDARAVVDLFRGRDMRFVGDEILPALLDDAEVGRRLAGLRPHEAAAYSVLLDVLHPSREITRAFKAGDLLNWPEDFPTPRSPAARKKAKQRSRAKLPADERDQLDEMLGRSGGRPTGVDWVSELCAALHVSAGLTTAEITAVLSALGKDEPDAGSGSAQARVQRRIDRARHRAH